MKRLSWQAKQSYARSGDALVEAYTESPEGIALRARMCQCGHVCGDHDFMSYACTERGCVCQKFEEALQVPALGR